MAWGFVMPREGSMAAVSYAVDVSGNQPSHQPWAAFGVHMGIAKASEGEHTRDPWFTRHITDIKAARLLPGGYHFAWPNQPAGTEAANYIAAVYTAAASPGFVHILDLERYPNGARNYLGATTAEIRQYAHDWIAAVKRSFPGQRVGIYTSGDDILDGHLPGNEDFLWYPKYPVQGRTFAQAAAAARPAPSGHTVWGWQFTSVPRDQSVIYMSPTALRAWAAGTTPTVQEDDVTPEDIKAIAAATRDAILDRVTDDPTTSDDSTKRLLALLWDTGKNSAQANANVVKVLAQVAGLNATVAALAKGGGLTAEQITAASEAGARAALAELGDALTPKES
jgi:GH25 family lysozyme M1 (1,4-beta-N-acetylmuramidase)/outer membrane murein-binding lipoprotein Lpp